MLSDDGLIRVTVLCEDEGSDPELLAGHGFSALVEVGGRRVLLDVGPGREACGNARTLGVSLGTLDGVVLSHGHYDHVGGLTQLLTTAGPQEVVAHPHIFRRRFAERSSGELRDVGFSASQADHERLGARFTLTEHAHAWGSGLTTTGTVPEGHDERRPGTLRVQSNGQVTPDDFADDLSLVACLGEGIVVVTGCAHAGLRNIVDRAREVTGRSRVDAVVGGTHLCACDEASVRDTARWLSESGVKALVPCHCTGANAVRWLAEYFDGPVAPIHTGDVVRLSRSGGLGVSRASSNT